MRQWGWGGATQLFLSWAPWEIRAEPQAAGRQERASWKPTSEALAQPRQQAPD